MSHSTSHVGRRLFPNKRYFRSYEQRLWITINFYSGCIINPNYCRSTILALFQVDGGMTANSLLMQLQADIAGVKIAKASMPESTALGAAMVAGAAVGQWDLSVAMDIPCEIWTPTLGEDERDIRYTKWKQAVEKAMGWDVL